MNDDFRTLNRRNRRKWDSWNYRLQWITGILAGLCVLVTFVMEVLRHVH